MKQEEWTDGPEIACLKAELSKGCMPLLSKGKVARIILELANRWRDHYRQKCHEDSQKVLDRMEELDTLYKEREESREKLLTDLLAKQEEEAILFSSKAFCCGVCKERMEYAGAQICTCGRRCRYETELRNQFAAFAAERDKYIEEFKSSQKWNYKTKGSQSSASTGSPKSN